MWDELPPYLDTVIGLGMVTDQRRALVFTESFQGICTDAGTVFCLRSRVDTTLLQLHTPSSWVLRAQNTEMQPVTRKLVVKAPFCLPYPI